MAAKTTVLLALSMFVFAGVARHVNGISCEDVLSKLFPCQPFLTGSGKISGFCCDGVETLKQIAVYNAQGKVICQCLKQALVSIGISNPITQKAVLLPQLCKISLPFDINPTNDCQANMVAYENMQEVEADNGKCACMKQNGSPKGKLD